MANIQVTIGSGTYLKAEGAGTIGDPHIPSHNANLQVGDSDVSVSNPVPIDGTVAHDAADSGNPIKIGGKGNASAPTAAGEGDRVDASFDLQGRLRVSNEAALSAATDSVQIGDGTHNADVTAAGALAVDGSAVTQPISAASLPLPTGAATAANQLPDGHNVTVDNAVGSPANVQISDGTDTALVSAAGALNVDGSAVTQPISAASLPLPTGAATAANQLPDGHNVTIDNAAGGSAVNIQDGGNSITVDGTITANAGTGDFLSVSAHTTNEALKEATAIAGQLDDTTTTAATEDNVAPVRITAQRALHTNIRDASGTELGTAGSPLRTDPTGSTTQPISAASLPLPTGAATAAAQLPDGHNVTVDNTVGSPANVQLSDGTDTALISAAGALNVDGSGVTQPISAASLPLPTGAATSANQLPDGHNVTIDNAAGGSAVNIQDGGNSITVDGTVTADAGTGFPSVQTEDAASAGGETGLILLGYRQDADTSPVTATGDFHGLIFDSAGNLKVNVKAGAAGGVTHTDDAAFTVASDDGVPAFAAYQSTPDTVNDNDAGILRMTQRRALYTTHETPAGDSMVDDTNDAMRVNVVAGSAGGASATDDSAFTIGTDAVAPAGYLADETTPDPVNEGDVGVARMTLTRKAYAVLSDPTSENNAGVDASGHLQVDIAADSVGIGGGTQYTEGDTDATIVGTALMFEDAADTLRAATGTVANGLDVDVTRVSGTVTVDGSGVTQPISAVSLPLPTGAATSANQLPDGHNVTIDNAAGGSAVNIQDGGNSITVDAPVATPVNVQISDGTDTALVTAAGLLQVDGSGVTQPVSGTVTANAGTGTFTVDGSGVTQPVSGTVTANAGTGFPSVQTEDAASAGGETGLILLGYRQDADTSPVTATGDFHGLIFDDAGNLKVNVKAGSAGGASSVDDSAFTIGTDSVAPTGYLADETTPDPVNEGDVGIARMTLTRKAYAVLSDPTSENNAGVDASGHLQIDIAADSAGLATAANQLPDGHNVTVDNAAGGSAVNIQDGGNSITVDAPVATPVNVQLSDGTDTALVSAAGALSVDGSGVTQPISAASLPLPTGAATAAAQLPDGHNVTVDNAAGGSAVNIQDGGNSITVDAPVATPVNVQISDGTDTALVTAAGLLQVDGSGVTQPVSGTVTANAGTGTRTVAGGAADDAAASGNPVQIGMVARTADPTAVAAGDVAYPMIDTLRKVVTRPYATPGRSLRGAQTLTGTGNVAIISAQGAGTRVYVTSISASNTSGTAVRVDFKDGTTTVVSFYLAASGGGASHTMPYPIRCADNTAFNGALSAAVTDVRVSAQGFAANN